MYIAKYLTKIYICLGSKIPHGKKKRKKKKEERKWTNDKWLKKEKKEEKEKRASKKKKKKEGKKKIIKIKGCLAEKPTCFWKQMTSSFSLKKFTDHNQFLKKMCVHIWRVNAVKNFPEHPKIVSDECTNW